MTVDNKTNTCFCGHNRSDHAKYINNGRNQKGSRYVCTKDNCSRWNQCDLTDKNDIQKTKKENHGIKN